MRLAPTTPEPLPTDDLPTPGPASEPGAGGEFGASATARASAVPPTFSESIAVGCGGRPGADRVVSALRAVDGLIPPNAPVVVRTGPLCAGTWQYTVVLVTGREPLQAVTRGGPDTPQFVTAGTNVCGAEVRSTAPPGILALARCE